MDIHRATSDDFGALSKLASEVIAGAYTYLGSEEELNAWIEYSYSTAAIASYDGLQWFYVGKRDHPDGMGWLELSDDGSALLGGLYVRTPQQGIGSALVDHRLRVATEQGATQARCLVFAQNQPAQRLLSRYGFTEHSRTQNKDREPGEPFADAWVLDLRRELPYEG